MPSTAEVADVLFNESLQVEGPYVAIGQQTYWTYIRPHGRGRFEPETALDVLRRGIWGYIVGGPALVVSARIEEGALYRSSSPEGPFSRVCSLLEGSGTRPPVTTQDIGNAIASGPKAIKALLSSQVPKPKTPKSFWDVILEED